MLQKTMTGMSLDNVFGPTSSLLCEACIEDKQYRIVNIREGEGVSDQTFGNCTFQRVWPHENHIHGLGNVFRDLHQ